MPKKSKRSSRTSRRHRGRSRASKRNSPLAYGQRYFKQKLTGIQPVYGEPDGQYGSTQTFVFSRFDYAGIISSVKGINSPPRWNQVYKNYEQYSVTGFAFRWIPTNCVGTMRTGQTLPMSSQIVSVWSYEDVDTYDVSNYNDDKVVALESFKAHSSVRGMRVYRSNGPLARQMKSPWQDTNQSTTTANGLPKAAFAFRIKSVGFE